MDLIEPKSLAFYNYQANQNSGILKRKQKTS
jgi:hypothetical protein